jgi:thymidylate synthase (FAD)
LTDPIRPGDNPNELLVFDHGFVRLDAAMATDLSVVNSARVSFAVRRDEMDDRDKGLIKFLMRDRHGSPFEHNSFRFHIRTPMFVAREWFRHRIGCLTGDAEVTFVNNEGSVAYKKTMAELHEMWTVGEHNGHALTASERAQVDELVADGLSVRAIARKMGRGRRAVTSYVTGDDGMRDARTRLKKMRLRVLDEDTNEFTVGHICEVFDKGVQPVYRLLLEDGKEIDATVNHRFLTSDGWRKLGDAVGIKGSGAEARMTRTAFMVVNGRPAYRDPEWLGSKRRAGLSVQEIADEAGCSYHTIRKWLKRNGLSFAPEERNFPKGSRPWNKDVKGYKIQRNWTPEWKQAIREARSGERSNFWRGGLSTDRASVARWTREQAARVHFQYNYTCQSCGTQGGKLHAHHIVPVWLSRDLATDIGNLVSVCESCHRAIHRNQESELDFMNRFGHLVGRTKAIALGDLPQRKGCRLTGHPVRVIGLRYVGMERTYDLSVEGPWHNFVANGIVVHNSFNEESARYHKMADDFYVPDVEAVRSQVGKPGAYTFEPVDEALALETQDTLRTQYKEAYATYQGLVDKGIAKEVARSVLPVGIYTQFYWTINARALMNFLSLRNSEFAQYEIRTYAQAIERFFEQEMPLTYECFVEFGRKQP